MDLDERLIEGYRVVIDRTLCVGFGDCVEEAPEIFALDDENVAVFVASADPIPPERVVAACRACPVDALSVWDGDGRLLVP